MDGGTIIWVVVVAAIVALIVAIALIVRARKRRSQLRDWFGPEYDRTVDEHDRRRHAERDLQERVERHEGIHLRPLSPAARNRYDEEWHQVQESFVDRPRVALEQAGALVTNLLRDRGYPVDDFDEQAALVSVDHPHVVDRYRTAHDIRERSEAGHVSTEDLREAMVCYRSLFEEALVDDTRRESA